MCSSFPKLLLVVVGWKIGRSIEAIGGSGSHLLGPVAYQPPIGGARVTGSERSVLCSLLSSA